MRQKLSSPIISQPLEDTVGSIWGPETDGKNRH